MKSNQISFPNSLDQQGKRPQASAKSNKHVSFTCTYSHLSSRPDNCTSHIPPYPRVYKRATMHAIKMGHTVRFVTGSYRYLTQALPQRHSERPFLMGSCLLPLKIRITGLSQSDSASWRAVPESEVTVNSHSTTALRRSLKMAQHLSCFLIQRFGSDV